MILEHELYKKTKFAILVKISLNNNFVRVISIMYILIRLEETRQVEFSQNKIAR